MLDLRTPAQFQGSEMSPGLFQNFICAYIRLSTLAVEHSVSEHSIMNMTAGFQSRRFQIEVGLVGNFRFPFYQIYVQNQWGRKI